MRFAQRSSRTVPKNAWTFSRPSLAAPKMNSSVALETPPAVIVRSAESARRLDWSQATVWDFETTGLSWWKDEAYALAVLMDDAPFVFIGDALAVAMQQMRSVCEDSSKSIIAYNAKFDLHFASRDTLRLQARVIDPSFALFLIDENEYSGSGHGLKHAVKTIFGYEMTDFGSMLGTIQYETGELKVRKCSLCTGKGWRGRDHLQCERCTGVGTEARPVIRTRKRTIDEVSEEVLANYAGADVYWTARVWEWASAKLEANRDLRTYFYDVASKALVNLYAGEHRGIRINMDAVVQLRAKYLARISAIDTEIKVRTGVTVEGRAAINDDGQTPDDLSEAGEPNSSSTVNLDSPAQVDWFLYKYLGLKRPTFRTKRKAKDGSRVASKWQTDENCLLYLAKHSATDIPKLLWERRKCAKYVGTYLNNMVEEAILETDHSPCVQERHRCHFPDDEVWVLYPNFNMTVARTGRLSSSGVLNFQNIPHSDEFRSLFIARPGCVFVIADAKQIELRFLAHFSGDPALVGPYSDPNRDLHQETADFLELDGKAGRYVAKTFNFAEVYEVYGNTAAMQLFRDTEGEIDWSKEQAQAVLDRLRAGRPFVAKWKRNVVSYIEANGYIPTVEKRRRRLPQISSNQWALRKYAERQGINARIQGSVGDGFARVLTEDWLFNVFCLQVHDEVVLECKVVEQEIVSENIKVAIEGLTERYQTKVPILAEVATGQNWSAKA